MVRMYFRSRLPLSVHEQEEFYLVDYDFKGLHGQRNPREVAKIYVRFYREFEKIFGQKIAKFRSTASVIIMPTLEQAMKLKQLVEKYGGTAKVRKCVEV